MEINLKFEVCCKYLKNVSKYGVISGPCFPVFEITPYLDAFYAVYITMKFSENF